MGHLQRVWADWHDLTWVWARSLGSKLIIEAKDDCALDYNGGSKVRNGEKLSNSGYT